MSHKASVGGLYALHKTKSILIVSANSSLVNVPEDGWEVEVSKQETNSVFLRPTMSKVLGQEDDSSVKVFNAQAEDCGLDPQDPQTRQPFRGALGLTERPRLDE